MTVTAILHRAARLWPDRTAVLAAHGRLRYRDLAAAADRLVRRLAGLDLQRGDRVAVLADNQPAYLAAYFAVPSAGLVLLPLNTRLAVDEVRTQLTGVECRVLLHDAAHADAAHEATRGTDVVVTTLDPGTAGAGSAAGATVGPDDTAYLYFTSGSTGSPKAVMLSHRQVVSGALSSVLGFELDHRDVWLHAGPLFHLADAWAVWGLTALGGTHVAERFHPADAVATIDELGVTRTLLVPTALDMLVGAARDAGSRLPGLRAVGFGGAPMPADVHRRARAAMACPLVPTYGATELSGLCTTLSPDETDDTAWETVGRETPLHTVTIVDGEGQPVPDGQTGELSVTGPAVMTGYWREATATAAVLRGRTLHTGDLACREPDGRLRLRGRLKDMIISGGENVAALEVEQVLAAHAGVADVAVLGRPDPRWGEMVCAVVVARRDTAPPTLEELRGFARPRLAGYKLPRSLRIVDALPRTGSGKVDKSALRRLVEAGVPDGR